MITITLAWWMIPIIVFIGSVAFAMVYESLHPQSGPFPMPIVGMLWVIGGTIAALALVLGHFL